MKTLLYLLLQSCLVYISTAHYQLHRMKAVSSVGPVGRYCVRNSECESNICYYARCTEPTSEEEQRIPEPFRMKSLFGMKPTNGHGSVDPIKAPIEHKHPPKVTTADDILDNEVKDDDFESNNIGEKSDEGDEKDEVPAEEEYHSLITGDKPTKKHLKTHLSKRRHQRRKFGKNNEDNEEQSYLFENEDATEEPMSEGKVPSPRHRKFYQRHNHGLLNN